MTQSNDNPKQKKAVATREAYGQKLAELGKAHPDIVVLDADLSGSTKTGVFAKKYPDRFFNVGVAEQDLMATAAGLAQSGLTVFASTFAMFAAGRAWEVVRQSIAYPKLNVKICPTHAGITVGEDGASHQMIEDITLMRVLPGMKVLVPADEYQTASMMDFMMEDKGPNYLRLGRAAAPSVFQENYRFQIGKGDVILKGSDVCLFTTGFVTKATLDSATLLRSKGVSATVVCMGSIKPIDEDLIVQMAGSHRMLFTIEEHSVIGGLGSAVAEVLTEKHPTFLHRLGLQDQFGQSGPYQELLKHYRLDANGIAECVLQHSSKL